MDDQATLLLNPAPGHSSDAGVEKWAKPVATACRDELVQLREPLARAGVPDTNPHQGHDMPGMVTGDELRTIQGTKGAAFDALFLAAIRRTPRPGGEDRPRTALGMRRSGRQEAGHERGEDVAHLARPSSPGASACCSRRGRSRLRRAAARRRPSRRDRWPVRRGDPWHPPP
ncbi:DUF305 domain-containing protein [Streptomyces antimycoticus]|uniref:DUF305 domain-containing protein n=1 Tax=Streptomyces TaxID=1883 RepID=UPI0036F1146A